MFMSEIISGFIVERTVNETRGDKGTYNLLVCL